MLTILEIKNRLTDRKIAVIAERIGLHENTIRNFMSGSEPSYKTVKLLSDYLTGANSENG